MKKSLITLCVFIGIACLSVFFVDQISSNPLLSMPEKLFRIKYFSIGMISLFIIVAYMFLQKYTWVNTQFEEQVASRTEHFQNEQDRYKQLFQCVPELVVVHDLLGNIFKYNERFGVCEDNATKNFFTCFKEANSLKSLYAKLPLDTNTSIGTFTLNVQKKSYIVDLISIKTVYDKKDAVMTIARDITELKRMEQELYVAQKNEAIGTLASGMSHDFKNVLQNIKMYNQLTGKAQDMDAVYKNVEMIDGIVDNAFEYVNNLLQISKNRPEDYRQIEIADAVKENVLILEKIMPPEINLSVFNNAGDSRVSIVKGRFSQLLINLCVNAREAIEGEGEIQALIEKEEVKMIDFIKISISDTGCGISDDHMKDIFDPFYTTKGNKGTGLGLAMVRRAVRDFGGFITVDSKVGKGTIFNIYIPEYRGD